MSDWILALETSSEACSVALLGPVAVYAEHRVAPRRHTELLVPMIEAVLCAADKRPADLDLIAFGCGPGSFTGVRIAAAVAQGIALARDLPLVAVSSLAALAAGAGRLYGKQHVLSVLDARRGEVYAGAFELLDGIWQLRGAERVLPPEALAAPGRLQPWFAVGHGWDVYADRFTPDTAALPRLDLPYPCAEDIARLARAAGPEARVSAADALPVYLRVAVD